MRTTKSRIVWVVAGSVMLLVATSSCGSNDGGSGGGSSAAQADTVAVDVGNGMTVNLTKSKSIKVAAFVPNVADAYGQAQAQALADGAKALGLDVTTYDAAHDPNTQLTQMQTAMQSGDFGAAILQPVDGSVVCKIATEDFPENNILVVNQATPLCDYGINQTGASVEEIWAPGTLDFVGSNNVRAYIDGWFAAAATANPGPQKVVAVLGSQLGEQTRVIEAALKIFKANNPSYTVDTVYTDYSIPDAFNKTQTYLQGHPDTSIIMSAYTPDMSQGIVQAVDQAGLLGKVHIIDQGFGKFSLDQIEAGNVQFSTLFFPYNQMKLSLEAIVSAQNGVPGPRFVDDSALGTAEKPFTVTKDTISQLPADLRG